MRKIRKMANRIKRLRERALMSTIKQASVLVILAGLMSTANAGEYDPGILEFSATGQDMWGGGKGAEPVEKTYSTSWNSSTTLGFITGSENEEIFPAIPGTDAVIVSDWHLGFWEDHGNWHEHTSHALHDHNTGFGGHTTYPHWHDNLHWHDGFREDHEIFPAIPGTDAVFADTRTGVEAVLSTSGSVGVTSSLGFNGGTVDAAVAYDTSLELPDAPGVGEFFNLNPASAIGDVSLDTQFPKLTGEVSFSMSATIDAITTSCFIGAGCTTDSGSLLNISPFNAEILKINTDDLPNDTMSVFGLDDLAFDATKGTVYVDLLLHKGGVSPVISLPFVGPRVGVGINLGDITLDYPDFNTSGSLSPDGESVVSSGTVDNIVRINADLDAAATLKGIVWPLGVVAKVGPLTFRGDLLDIDVGPTMDLSQDFKLTPTLMVDLEFDHPVLTESGVEIYSWSGALSDIPDFALHDEHAVEVTPTYWLDAKLDNQTSLDFDMTFSLDVLKGSITLLGIDGVGILSEVFLDQPFVLIDQDYPLFSIGSADVFNESFGFSGFQRITTDSFVLAANSPSYVVFGSSRSGSDLEPVPEPATLALMGIGIVGLIGAGYRKRKMRQE
ncbi:MAG: PEP-CTERM sorting domain-containing protein [Candidatus Anammoxibacter sp.]